MDSTLLRLDLNKGGFDLTYFIENNLWDLLEISPDMRKQMYSSHDDDLSVVVYTLVLRRKALFFVVNYIAPPVAISFLSLLLFLIPPEVGKRMGNDCFLILLLIKYSYQLFFLSNIKELDIKRAQSQNFGSFRISAAEWFRALVL